MKKLNGAAAVILGLAAYLVIGSHSAMAQTNSAISASEDDFTTMLETLEMTPPIPASELPEASEVHGFYSAQHPDWPPAPADVLDLKVWSLGGDGMYVLDDTNVDYPALALSEPAAPVHQAGGFRPDFDFSTNDLSLDMVSESNGVANLVVYPPWNAAPSDIYDLLETTNLTSLPIDWQWVLRTAPGETNLVDDNATNAQEFYALSLPNDRLANDSLGTNFWIAFCDMFPDGNNDLSLYISSPVGATGTVTIPGLGFTNNFSLTVGTVTNVGIPYAAMIMLSDNDEVETNHGIYITSSQPVSVYGFDYDTANSAAFTGYPTPLLGTNYCVMARPSLTQYGGGNSDWHSQFAIVATEDRTTVTITPSPTADLAGSRWTNAFTMQGGNTYQIASSNYTNDVTGTLVTSDKPIAVFAGDSIAYVPDYNNKGNPLVQEQLPVDSWGTQALAISFAGRTNGDTYRVLAAYSNTVVTVSGAVEVFTYYTYYPAPSGTTTNEVVVVTNQAGQFYDICLQGPAEFQASQPIQVAHFGNGGDWDSVYTGNNGDPCEILLPPTGYYLGIFEEFSG